MFSLSSFLRFQNTVFGTLFLTVAERDEWAHQVNPIVSFTSISSTVFRKFGIPHYSPFEYRASLLYPSYLHPLSHPPLPSATRPFALRRGIVVIWDSAGFSTLMPPGVDYVFAPRECKCDWTRCFEMHPPAFPIENPFLRKQLLLPVFPLNFPPSPIFFAIFRRKMIRARDDN